MWLSNDTFKTVITHTPLLSIDLIVRNAENQVLLGKRVNAPAKGFWFVPGGRVLKDEMLDQAFVRLLQDELGIISGMRRDQAKFLGVYEHFYNDNVFDANASTHYVVLGYEVMLEPQQMLNLPTLQHEQYVWWDKKDLLAHDEVHGYSKNYL